MQEKISILCGMENFALLGLAIAPAMALAIFIYWKDKFEKEPLQWLLWSYFLGIPAAIGAGLSSYGLSWLLDQVSNITANTKILIDAFISVAFVEEFFKFLIIEIFLYRKKVFNEPYDGITYAVMVSMGFATFENILYVSQGGWATAFVRMFTAVPAHAVFGVMMGYFLGIARFSDKPKFNKWLAILAPSLLHGFYDVSLFLKNIPFMYLGAIISLILGILLSLKAIRIHQKSSPFNPSN